MHPIHLIYSALKTSHKPLPPLPSSPVTAVCAVTGDEGWCVPRKAVLGSSFTNANLLAAPQSEFVSVAVLQVWEYGYKTAEDKQREKRPERMSSWFCDGATFEELDRQGVRAKVLQPEMPSIWTAYATTSYKKHGSLRARVNTDAQRVWLFEERLVDCSDMAKVQAWWGVLNTALRAGFGRTILETLDCPPYVMAKHGLAKWQAFEAWAHRKVNSALYAFLCYLLPSQEELKSEPFILTPPSGGTGRHPMLTPPHSKSPQAGLLF